MPTKENKVKVPKYRTVKQTINLNNGNKLTYEVNAKAYKYPNGHYGADSVGNWYRNGKLLTNNSLKHYSFIDNGVRKVLRPDGNIHGQQWQRLNDKANNYQNKIRSRIGKSVEYIDYNNKLITLNTKGRMNLTTIPTDMLDSILVSTGRSGTNIKDNLGLIGKESTFGGRSVPMESKIIYTKNPKETAISNIKQGVWSKYQLTNNHAFSNNPYFDYHEALDKKYPNSSTGIKEAEDDIKYALNNGIVEKNATPIYYPSDLLADAFIRYSKNPNGYNSGQVNYASMVTNIGNEVYNEPQIQAYINSPQGQAMLQKGKKERKTLSGKY